MTKATHKPFKKFRSTVVGTAGETHTDFDLVDNHGRKIGYRIRVTEMTWEETDSAWGVLECSAKRFSARTTVTRNGMGFGASTRDIVGDDLAEVMAKARKREAGALRRYIKKFGA